MDPVYVNGVTDIDNPTKIYHPILQLSSPLWAILASFS